MPAKNKIPHTWRFEITESPQGKHTEPGAGGGSMTVNVVVIYPQS